MMLYTCCHVGKVSWVELSLFEDYVLRLESEFVCPSPVRFLTDPNYVGFGKVGATDVPPEFLEKPYSECPALEPYGSLASTVGVVKPSMWQ